MLWDNAACVDMNMYHLPMIQLLIEGWNPVTDAFAEGICSSLGLDIWGMASVYAQKTKEVVVLVGWRRYLYTSEIMHIEDALAWKMPYGTTMEWPSVCRLNGQERI